MQLLPLGCPWSCTSHPKRYWAVDTCKWHSSPTASFPLIKWDMQLRWNCQLPEIWKTFRKFHERMRASCHEDVSQCSHSCQLICKFTKKWYNFTRNEDVWTGGKSLLHIWLIWIQRTEQTPTKGSHQLHTWKVVPGLKSGIPHKDAEPAESACAPCRREGCKTIPQVGSAISKSAHGERPYKCNPPMVKLYKCNPKKHLSLATATRPFSTIRAQVFYLRALSHGSFSFNEITYAPYLNSESTYVKKLISNHHAIQPDLLSNWQHTSNLCFQSNITPILKLWQNASPGYGVLHPISSGFVVSRVAIGKCPMSLHETRHIGCGSPQWLEPFGRNM